MKKSLVFWCLAVSSIFADSSLEVSPTYDEHFSPYAGAGNLISLQQCFEKIEDRLFPFSPISGENLDLKNIQNISTQGKWGRITRSVLFWVPESVGTILAQHEVFGHGYRIRDLGSTYAKVNGYEIGWFSGATDFEPTSKLTASQNLTIAIAGIEADNILANRIRLKWLSSKQLDPRQYFIYSLSSQDLTGYSFTVHSTPKVVNNLGNDIEGFLFYVNQVYPDGHLSYRKVRNLSLLNLTDPFLWSSFVSYWLYGQFGFTSAQVPMFHVGSIGYLPTFRVGLTPFGLQYFLENYFLKDSMPTMVYLKWGQHGANIFYGVGLESPKLFAWKQMSFGFKLDLWNQPNILFDKGALSVTEIMDWPADKPYPRLYPDSEIHAKSPGVSASMIATYEMTQIARFNLELGYKTKGYLPGESLRQTPIIRGGLTASF